jgi:Na+/melibiose symporter-like transporter
MKGKGRKSCQSRCFGGDRPSRLIITFCLINIPGAVFGACVCYPFSKDIGYEYVFYIQIALQLLSTILMFLTGLRDPGVFPKNFFDK